MEVHVTRRERFVLVLRMATWRCRRFNKQRIVPPFIYIFSILIYLVMKKSILFVILMLTVVVTFFFACTEDEFAQDTDSAGSFFKNNQELLGLWYLKECRRGDKDGYESVPSKLQSVEFTSTTMTLRYSEKMKEYRKESDGSLTELSESNVFSGEYDIPIHSGDGPMGIPLGMGTGTWKADGVWPAFYNGVECVFREPVDEATWAFSSLIGRDKSGNLSWIRLDGEGNDTNQYLYYFKRE